MKRWVYFNNNLYITDEDKDYVIVMDTEGNNIKKIISENDNDNNSPQCVHVFDNKIFVGDSYNNRIQVYDLINNKYIYNIENLGFVYSIYATEKQLYFTNNGKLHIYNM